LPSYLKKPEWLCFDLDGTLVDSAPDIAVAMNYALQEMGLAPATLAEVRNFIGDGAYVLLQRGLSHAGVEQPSEADMLQARRYFDLAYGEGIAEHSICYPDCETVLASFSAQAIPLALVTNKPRQFVPPLLQRLGLSDYFSVLLCGDDLAQKKPHPAPIQSAVAQMQKEVTSGYMVGDSVTDMEAAWRAGAGAIYMSYGYNRGVSVEQFNPIRLNRLAQLLNLFERE